MRLVILFPFLKPEGILGVEGQFFTWLCLLSHLTSIIEQAACLTGHVFAVAHSGGKGLTAKKKKKSYRCREFNFLPFLYHPITVTIR